MTDDAIRQQPAQSDLEAEIARTRAELANTLDELATRLDPRIQAANAASQAKVAAADAGSFLTGGGLPEEDDQRARNAKLLMATAAVGAVALIVIVVRFGVKRAKRNG